MGDKEDMVGTANCVRFGGAWSCDYQNRSGSLSGHTVCLVEGNMRRVRWGKWQIREHLAEKGSLRSLVQGPPSCSHAALPPSSQPPAFFQTPSSPRILRPIVSYFREAFCPSLTVTLSCSEFTQRVHVLCLLLPWWGHEGIFPSVFHPASHL